MTDLFEMGSADIPQELAHQIRVNRLQEFMPILQNNFLEARLSELEEVTKDTDKLSLKVVYKPMSIGKLRLLLHVEQALKTLKKLGFSNKDVDDLKGVFSDTNLYLLCGTVIVGTIHVSTCILGCRPGTDRCRFISTNFLLFPAVTVRLLVLQE